MRHKRVIRASATLYGDDNAILARWGQFAEFVDPGCTLVVILEGNRPERTFVHEIVDKHPELKIRLYRNSGNLSPKRHCGKTYLAFDSPAESIPTILSYPFVCNVLSIPRRLDSTGSSAHVRPKGKPSKPTSKPSKHQQTQDTITRQYASHVYAKVLDKFNP